MRGVVDFPDMYKCAFHKHMLVAFCNRPRYTSSVLPLGWERGFEDLAGREVVLCTGQMFPPN